MTLFLYGFLTATMLVNAVWLLRHRIAKALGREAGKVGEKLGKG